MAMNYQIGESRSIESPITAVILDLDGTLLNTEQATKSVLEEVLATYGKVVDHDKEEKRLGMMHKDAVTAIVKDYDLPLSPQSYSQLIFPLYREKWAKSKALPGANRLLKHLQNHQVPFALASNSARENVDMKISSQAGWRESFSVILGSNQVKMGKPAPDLFLEAASRMGVDATHCLVIEDSVVGVQAAKAAGMKVVAVPSLPKAANQYSSADCVLHSLLDFQPELWGLPPFEDCIDGNAFPIESIYLKGLFSNGLLYISEDSKPSALPDQVSGLFFGWVKINSCEIFKAVTIFRWHHARSGSKRKIHLCIVDETEAKICDQQIELMLVGYIRGFSNREDLTAQVEEEKSIASNRKDLTAQVEVPEEEKVEVLKEEKNSAASNKEDLTTQVDVSEEVKSAASNYLNFPVFSIRNVDRFFLRGS